MLRYLKSREFWLIILGTVAFIVLAYVIFFFVFLPRYTMHGESVIVPDVTKMDLAEASKTLEADGLRYEVADSLYITGLPPLAIIAQDPTGVSKVKPGRMIYLTVNKKVPPMVRVPDILAVSQYQAKLLLEGANLSIQRMEYVPHEHKNLVLAAFHKGKRLEPGDTLPKFSKILLRVGQGKGTLRIETPDLVGQHYQTAIGMLHRAGLNIGVVRFDKSRDEEDGTVYQQNPRYFPEDSIRLGSEVDLFIAGPEPEESIEEMIFQIESDTTFRDDSAPADSMAPSRSAPSSGRESAPEDF